MNIADVTATLDRLLKEGHRVLADFASFVNEEGDGSLDALSERLREQSRHFFDETNRQLQDQTQPWIAMLRSWAQIADGGSPAELLLTPTAWWRPVERGTDRGNDKGTSQRERVEAAAAELADARDAYLLLLKQAADDAVDRFAASLRARDGEDESLRQIYQHWLNSAEAAYEDMLASEAFAEAAGRLTNAWSEILLIMQQDLDRLFESAGMPTRRELVETQAQLQELRRQQRARDRQQQADIAALRAELDKLRADRAAADAKPIRRRTAKPTGTA